MTRHLLGRSRFTATVALLLAALGAVAWTSMNRQEDPFFPYRYGFVLVDYPGADAQQVERNVLEALEEELAQVEAVNNLTSVARAGFSKTLVELHQRVYDTDQAWDRVEDAIRRGRATFPAGVEDPVLRERQTDPATVVLAVTGSDDPVELRHAAEHLKNRLLGLDEVSRIWLYGDPGEQITVEYDSATARQLNVSPTELARQIRRHNRVTSSGSATASGGTIALRAGSELESLAALRRTPITLPSGETVPLDQIAAIRHASASPARSMAWLNGARAVAVAIETPANEINSVRFGQRLRKLVDRIRSELEPLEIREMFYQPAHTKARLAELGRSLFVGVAIVGTLLIVTMGRRPGLLVASLVPLVTLSGLAVYFIGGGVLQQMTVIGLVIALGMLVDNAIVMIENIQWHIDSGRDFPEAATQSVRELSGPLAAATATTLGAFVPMLLSNGDSADFTRAIPIMVIVTLSVSYLYAMLVAPNFASRVLRRSDTGPLDLSRVGDAFASFAVARPGIVLIAALTTVGIAAAASSFVEQDFFPSTNRQQVIIDVTFPEGTRIDYTANAVRRLNERLEQLDGVINIHAFAGDTGPRFYYNLRENPRSPHRARLVVETSRLEANETVIAWARGPGSAIAPRATVVATRLDQGPPVSAPVALRIFAQDRNALSKAVEAVMTEVQAVDDAIDIRHTLGLGIPSLRFQIGHGQAARLGVDRQHVARALFGRTHGLSAGLYRATPDPVPIRVRSPEGIAYPPSVLGSVPLSAGETSAKPLSVMHVATERLTWDRSVVNRRNLQRYATVLSEIANGSTYAGVMEELRPRLQRLELPDGARIEVAGDAEKSREANTALFRVLPVGLTIIVLSLLLQFNSWRRAGVVLATVPLASAGIGPGLLFADQPFGFTAMLGTIALAGIVVNNAIVLIDVIDANMANGVARDQAIRSALARRVRPILLTAATTIGGILPLTFAKSTLWPPMAWAIISGLIASTILTFFVIPATCRLVLPARLPSTR